ncbi:MAG TPA: hypothetical protein PKO44_08205 [Candidatus Omnitrophota bacterium]|nr:hypothetical protein [Candidatus Omnitrophota bacterium]
MEKKRRRPIVILLISFFLVILALLMVFGGSCRKETSPLSETQCVEVKVSLVEEPFAEEPPVLALELLPELPRTRVVESRIRSGNKGYVILDKEYTYFGIYTITREEMPIE